MSHETWNKPSGVMLGAVALQKVDRIDYDEGAQFTTFYGDAAVMPTFNRAELRDPKIVITTRDYASWNALATGTKGNLTFTVHDAEAGSDISKTYSNCVVLDRKGVWGDKTQAATITLGVESPDGQAGGLLS